LDPNADPLSVTTLGIFSESDPEFDSIVIPNPATTALKPTGFTLADARLGQRQTISFTTPSFTVLDVSVEATVALSDGRFCSSDDVLIDGTQATFSLPASCFGRSASSAAPRLDRASVCVVYRGGDFGDQVSQACWMWQ